jgi:CubicO group peptidase (beta-lactamase class C family)
MKILKKLAFVVLLVSTSIAGAANEALLNEIIEKAKTSESDSLVIIQDEKILYANYFSSADQVRNIQSITKSVGALAIGILLDQGKISSLDAPMSSWLPEWAVDSEKSKITLRMILNHTSGISDSQFSDLVAVARGAQAAGVGGRFEYSSVAVSLLQTVIEQSAGKKVEVFVKEKILDPLEIQDYFWNKDKAGNEALSGGLGLSTDGLIKIGKLILEEGSFKGRQIIKTSTLRLLLTKSQNYKSYGLLWWLQRPTGDADPNNYQLFSAWGWGGQFITVYPAKKLIAVRTKNPTTITDDKFAVQEFPDFRNLIGKWQ